MTHQQILLAERVVWLVAFLAMTIAVAAFDWRLGLFLAGLLLAVSNLDLRRRS